MQGVRPHRWLLLGRQGRGQPCRPQDHQGAVQAGRGLGEAASDTVPKGHPGLGKLVATSSRPTRSTLWSHFLSRTLQQRDPQIPAEKFEVRTLFRVMDSDALKVESIWQFLAYRYL